ncbi:unnamed protein product [Phytomonas sp. Hart1]|nr:unnamed protein product [Phytomonas sp. Hart1]|eukprot:CCW71259.1 unnamed protein product [Phytomonas sp. isolate Hart1]
MVKKFHGDIFLVGGSERDASETTEFRIQTAVEGVGETVFGVASTVGSLLSGWTDNEDDYPVGKNAKKDGDLYFMMYGQKVYNWPLRCKETEVEDMVRRCKVRREEGLDKFRKWSKAREKDDNSKNQRIISDLNELEREIFDLKSNRYNNANRLAVDTVNSVRGIDLLFDLTVFKVSDFEQRRNVLRSKLEPVCVLMHKDFPPHISEKMKKVGATERDVSKSVIEGVANGHIDGLKFQQKNQILLLQNIQHAILEQILETRTGIENLNVERAAIVFLRTPN